MGKMPTYTEQLILEKLHSHMVDEMLSKYSMHKPTWQGIVKRMKDNPEFTDKVHSVENEALAKWEKVGITALFGDNTDFNTQLFKMYVGNKKPFLTNETLELEERITAIEDAQSTK